MIPVSVRSIGLLLAALAGQLTAITLLPRTQGFAAALPTAGCVGAFVFSLWMIARLAHGGTGLSILIPFLNAIIPLGAVAIGVFVYDESASWLKILVLVSACGLIGVASRIH